MRSEELGAGAVGYRLSAIWQAAVAVLLGSLAKDAENFVAGVLGHDVGWRNGLSGLRRGAIRFGGFWTFARRTGNQFFRSKVGPFLGLLHRQTLQKQ